MKQILIIYFLIMNLGSLVSTISFAELPNKDYETVSSPSNGLYKKIEKYYSTTKLKPLQLQSLNLDWPLKDSFPNLLSRFGIPQSSCINFSTSDFQLNVPLSLHPKILLPMNLNPTREFCYVFFHEALDIYRSTPLLSDHVYSPVSGKARIFYDVSTDKNVSAYLTAVIIEDENSGFVVVLLHIAPAPFLNAENFRYLQRGDFIGTLAPALHVNSNVEEHYRHTHLSILDPHKMQVYNPLPHVNGYSDNYPPRFEEIYLLNEKGEKQNNLSDGIFDILISANDQDTFSKQAFMPDYIQYKIFDGKGHQLLNGTCQLFDLNASAYPEREKHILDYIDYGNAKEQLLYNDDRSSRSDVRNPLRLFRIAMNRLSTNDDGQCVIQAKRQVSIKKNIDAVRLEGSLIDISGNRTPFRKWFRR